MTGPHSIREAFAPSLSSAHERKDGQDIAILKRSLEVLKRLDAGAVFYDDDMRLEDVAIKEFGAPVRGIAENGQHVPEGRPGLDGNLSIFCGEEFAEVGEKLDLSGHGVLRSRQFG